ncbi:hypothetical protein pdam_00004425, partial [Pocillopora damicornis]
IALSDLVTSSGYTGFGSLTEAPQDPPLTAEKAGTVNLYRSQKLVDDPEIDPLSNFVTLVKKKLTMMKKPNGTSIFPARTCKDLYMSYPDLPSGFYWIDPNDGLPNDAIRVRCEQPSYSTCLYPKSDSETFTTEKKKWFTGADGYKWLGKDLRMLKNIEYVSEPSQLEFLRLLSDRARQRIVYNCKDSVAWSDEKNEFSKSVKIKADNGVKDGKWHHTVLEVDTPKPHRLPIVDIAAYDIGDSGEEFGIEIERLCFT